MKGLKYFNLYLFTYLLAFFTLAEPYEVTCHVFSESEMK